MTDESPDIATLRWLIDTQKSDCENMRGQLRRYFAVIVSVSIALTIAYVRAGPEFTNFLSASIGEQGLLWQTDILGKKAASVFTGLFSRYTAIFSGIGMGMVGFGLLNVIGVEATERCVPNGNAEDMINSGVQQLEEWVRSNDELVEDIDQQRKEAIRYGFLGVFFILSSYLIKIVGATVMVLGLILYLLLLVILWKISMSDITHSDRRSQKLFLGALLLIFITSPLTYYQETYGYFATPIRTIFLIISISPVIYWIRWEILYTLEILRVT